MIGGKKMIEYTMNDDKAVEIEVDGKKYLRKAIKTHFVKQGESYLNIMEKERQRLRHKKSKTKVAMFRALQFQKTNDIAYRCNAGDGLITIMENGDLVPCRRMPIVVGNVLKGNLYKLYKNNKLLKELRKHEVPKKCSKCEYSKSCNGGLKCLSYALHKKYCEKDIGCNYQ